MIPVIVYPDDTVFVDNYGQVSDELPPRVGSQWVRLLLPACATDVWTLRYGRCVPAVRQGTFLCVQPNKWRKVPAVVAIKALANCLRIGGTLRCASVCSST